MGFQVRVVVALPRAPSESLMYALDHQFGSATHEPGSKLVSVSEHVSMSSEADAVEFVRGLVLDAVPPGSKIAETTSIVA